MSEKSRSEQRRWAALKGEPAPTFGAEGNEPLCSAWADGVHAWELTWTAVLSNMLVDQYQEIQPQLEAVSKRCACGKTVSRTPAAQQEPGKP